MPEKLCPVCQKPVGEDDAFCPYCGTPLEQQKEEKKEEAPDAQPGAGKASKAIKSSAARAGSAISEGARRIIDSRVWGSIWDFWKNMLRDPAATAEKHAGEEYWAESWISLIASSLISLACTASFMSSAYSILRALSGSASFNLSVFLIAMLAGLSMSLLLGLFLRRCSKKGFNYRQAFCLNGSSLWFLSAGMLLAALLNLLFPILGAFALLLGIVLYLLTLYHSLRHAAGLEPSQAMWTLSVSAVLLTLVLLLIIGLWAQSSLLHLHHSIMEEFFPGY